jgi:hypothetical protein
MKDYEQRLAKKRLERRIYIADIRRARNASDIARYTATGLTENQAIEEIKSVDTEFFGRYPNGGAQ